MSLIKDPSGSFYLESDQFTVDYEENSIKFVGESGEGATQTGSYALSTMYCIASSDRRIVNCLSSRRLFKIGVNNTAGVAVCLNHGTAFRITTDYIPGASYPDNGCSTEMYSCASFLEVETLSPLYTLKPGEACEHTENWELFAEDSADIKDLHKYFL